jgi:hypothetical protein
MYKYAKRCQTRMSVKEEVRQSVNSYLAVINATALLSADKRWFSVDVLVSDNQRYHAHFNLGNY